MKISLFFFFLFTIILTELDRNFIIRFSIINYYINNFPNRIIYGINNSINKLFMKKYIFDHNILKFNKFLISNRRHIENSFNESRRKNLKIEIVVSNKYSQLEPDNKYRCIFFKLFNKNNDKNLEYFPIINTLLKNYKNIRNCFFSIMEHKKELSYHRGPDSGILRYHFPIIVKKNSCYLEIMGKKMYNDKPILFDDTYPHKLVKNDDSLRVVLICDIDNPYSIFHPHTITYK